MVDSNETVMYENGRDAGYSEGYDDGVKVALQAIEEIQQYRAIGTIEELQALKEKNEPKKPIKNNPIINKGWSKESMLCPVCNGIVSRFGDNYCPKCGQKLDWQ